MILNYNVLTDLPVEIKDSIVGGMVVVYRQKDNYDDKGTRYIMVVGNMYFRMGETGKLILPPFDKMPEDADKTDVVILQKD